MTATTAHHRTTFVHHSHHNAPQTAHHGAPHKNLIYTMHHSAPDIHPTYDSNHSAPTTHTTLHHTKAVLTLQCRTPPALQSLSQRSGSAFVVSSCSKAASQTIYHLAVGCNIHLCMLNCLTCTCACEWLLTVALTCLCPLCCWLLYACD